MAACEGSEQGYCSETNLGLMAAEFYTELAMLVYVSGAIVVDIFRFVSIQAFGGQLPFGSAQGRLAAIGAKFLQFGGGSSLVKAGQILKGVFAFVGAAGFVISLINEIYKAKREQDFGELVKPDLMRHGPGPLLSVVALTLKCTGEAPCTVRESHILCVESLVRSIG